MNCPTCDIQANRFGKDRKGNQRYQCPICKRTFIEPQEKVIGDMILSSEKAVACLKQLIEGSSIRSTERITGVHRDTVLRLLVQVGGQCEQLMLDRIHAVSVKDVQCDEIWAFVEQKEKTKVRNGIDDARVGDAYTFIAIERGTKLILAWHLGRRTTPDTEYFTEKLAYATSGHFQVSTDGFPAYREAIDLSLGTRVDFGQIIKSFGKPMDDDHRYSPPEVIELKKVAVFGRPDMAKICTSHVERQNLTVRMQMRRFTRLTNAFSKKWTNLYYALALHFAYYNFCRVHSTLRVTPAMESGLTDHIWTIDELVRESSKAITE
jgi:transposase-like protein/IS1 family transposase